MKKRLLFLVSTLLGALALPLRAQEDSGHRSFTSRIEGLPNDILGMLSLYVRPPQQASRIETFQDPGVQIEGEIQQLGVIINAIPDQERRNSFVFYEISKLARLYKVSLATIALYFVKAGYLEGIQWINEEAAEESEETGSRYGKPELIKNELLQKAISEQVNTRRPWLFHKPDWQIIQIALENGGTIGVEDLEDFYEELHEAPTTFLRFLEMNPSLGIRPAQRGYD